ncbi:kelch-like protein 31 [Amphiura filiformis]|uniref:kelch-like protein 31 n=1 Tax=Amphiura filiformis TaxID=82378 RepID=UPI003B2234F2
MAHVVDDLASLNVQRSNQSELCDVELKMADGILHCHKSVLVTCSKYFEAMFSHDAMIENVEDKVDLSQFTTDVMDSLLNFIYTGDMQLSIDNVCERLAAARYLQIDGVVETSCKFIIESLLPANYADFLNEISRLSLRDTELQIQKYIESQMCLEFAADSEGQYIKLPFDYLRQLLGTDNNLPHIKSEYEIFKLAIMWLNADLDTRREHTGQLLCECVRYPLIPLTDLTNHVLPYVSSKKDSNLMKAVTDAQTYHQRPDLHVSQYGGLRSTTLRFYTDAFIGLPQTGSSRFLQIWHHFEMGHTVYLREAIATSNTRVIPPGAAIAEMDGFIYVAGGDCTRVSPRVRVVQRYNPRNNTWSVCQSMTHRRHSFSLTSLDGKLYAVGGKKSPMTVECYDAKEDKWTEVASVVQPVYGHRATTVGDKLYIAGGKHGSIQCYDPAINKWECLAEECLATMNLLEMCSIGSILYVGTWKTDEDTAVTIHRFSLEKYESLTPLQLGLYGDSTKGELVCLISMYLEKNMIRIISSVTDSCPTSSSCYIDEIDPVTHRHRRRGNRYVHISAQLPAIFFHMRRVKIPKFMVDDE